MKHSWEVDGMMCLLLLATSLPQYMADQLNFYLNGALICLSGGLALLIAAVIVLKLHNKKADADEQ
jgi:hypothetical protein